MGKQIFDRIKKTASVLLAILFVVSLTAASAGATSSGSDPLSGIIPEGSSFDPSSFLPSFSMDSINNILSGLGLDSFLSGLNINMSWLN